MLRKMREHTKIIMVLTAVAFVAFMVLSWGMDITGVGRQTPVTWVGRVNGQKIPAQWFNERLQAAYQQTREAGQDLSDLQARALEEEVWNQVVTQILLGQEAERRAITVSDQEVVYALRHSPPRYLFTAPAFQTNGIFDYSKYQAALANPLYGTLWASVEADLRAELPVRKLEQVVTAGIFLSESEVREAYRRRHEKVRVALVRLDPVRLVPAESLSISPEEIGTYYRSHREESKVPEQARLAYLFFEVTPSAGDSARVQEHARALREELRGETDFAEVARREAADPVARTRGGDLGFLTLDQMDEDLVPVVKKMQVGEIAGPLPSPWGWQVIKLEDRRRGEEGQEEFHLRRILLPVEAGPESSQRAQAQAEEVLNRATGATLTLASAAAQLGLQVEETPFFARGPFVPGLGPLPQAMDFAFQAKPGALSQIIAAPGGLYLFQLLARRPAGYLPLEEVSAQIQAWLSHERRKEHLRPRAEEAARSLRQGTSLEEVARAFNLSVEESPTFTRDDYIPGVGSRNEFVGAAFGLPVGATSGLIETPEGFYFLRVVERQGIDEEAYAREKASFREELLTQARRRAFSLWLQALLAQAKIQDNRARVYGRG